MQMKNEPQASRGTHIKRTLPSISYHSPSEQGPRRHHLFCCLPAFCVALCTTYRFVVHDFCSASSPGTFGQPIWGSRSPGCFLPRNTRLLLPTLLLLRWRFSRLFLLKSHFITFFLLYLFLICFSFRSSLAHARIFVLYALRGTRYGDCIPALMPWGSGPERTLLRFLLQKSAHCVDFAVELMECESSES